MNSRNSIRQIAYNLLTGWAAIVVRTGLALYIVPFLLSRMGQESYGLLGLLGVFVSLANTADLGLRSALGRELSEHRARNDGTAFRELVSTAFALYICLALLIAALGWMIAPRFVVWMRVSDSLRPQALLLTRIYGTVSVLLSFTTPVFSAALSSGHRFDIINSVQIVVGTLSSVAVIVAVSIAKDALWAWAVVMLSMQLMTLASMFVAFKKYCPAAGVRTKHIKPRRLGPLLRLGGYMYSIQLTQALSEKSDPLVISYFFSPAGVALYTPGGRLSQLIRPIVTMLSDQLYPLTTRHHISHEREKLQRLLLLGTKYTLLLGSLFSAGLIVFAIPFCRLWLEKSLGDDYRTAALVLIGWAMADLTTYAAGAQWPVLLGMKRLRFLVWTQLPFAFLNLALSVYLVGFTSLGIPGVLVATIAIGLIRRPLLIWHTAHLTGLSLRSYLRESYGRPLLCFTLTLIVGTCMRLLLPAAPSWITLGASVLLTATAWGFLCFYVGLSDIERHALYSMAPWRRRENGAIAR